jgi:mono/diheme cytochrome c family protein
MKQNSQAIGALLILLFWSLGMAPMPAEVEEFGKSVYERHCLECHGTKGQGDGPEANQLIIKPANFHSPGSRMKPDGELLSKVVWGGVYSPMHGWGTRISRKEIHSVIRYIRLLAPYERDAK